MLLDLERLPGRPAGEVDGLAPQEARRRGLAGGHVHAILAEVRAPAALPSAASLIASSGPGRPPEGDRLLHLDLHPFNVLVDDSNQASGVIDWANAASGHPDFDRARSVAILNWDPAAVARRTDPAWAALAEGWQEAAGPTTPSASLWAYRYMLADLGDRYDTDELSGLRRAVDELSTH